MRRTRKRTGVWLPPDPYFAAAYTGTDPIVSTDQNVIKVDYLSLPAPLTSGQAITYDYPLVGDFNQDRIAGETGLTQGATMADSRFGYSLKRVVGKIFLGVGQYVVTGDVYQPSVFACTAGIIVRRTDDVGDPLTVQTGTQTYDAQGDPWLWRRTWLLQNQVQALSNLQNFPGLGESDTVTWPTNNISGQPSSLDGPHIDAKTRRTIKQEERLYMHLSIMPFLTGTSQTEQRLFLSWDLRFFGRIFQSAGNRRNASR